MAQRGIVFRRFRVGRAARNLEAGFTLQELVVTMGIAGALFSAVPSLHGLLQDNTLVAFVNLLRTDLSLTRSEALRRTHTVTICKSRDGIRCDPRAEWHDGWIVFDDPNDNGKRDAGETLVRVQGGLSDGVSLTFSAALNADNDLRYGASGFSEKNGTFTFCDARGPAKARAIVLNFVGRPYISTRKPSGDPLECQRTSPS